MNRSLLEQIESAAHPLPEEHSAAEKVILKHAMRSFGKRGYAATTLRGIAAEAGVTAPLVAYYFKSKEALFHRVAEIVMASLESEVSAAAAARGFLDAIRALARAHVELAERSPAAVEFMFSLLYGPQEGQPAPDVESMYRKTRATMAEVFERGIRSGEFRPRAGMTVGFLVEQLGSLFHDHVSRKFRIARLMERVPEKQMEMSERCGEWSLDLALEQFFLGAGDVRGLERT